MDTLLNSKLASSFDNMWFILAALLLFIFYFYSTRTHNYWTKRNVKHERPLPIFGNDFRKIFGIKSVTQIADEMYFKYPNEKLVGYFKGNDPMLIIRDPEIVKHIMSVDFHYFYKRGITLNDKEPLAKNLLNVDGDYWKLLRQRLTPVFTSSKLKNMFPLVVRCAEKLQSVAGELAKEGVEYDVRELMACFTTELIGACGFGIEMDTLSNNESHFRKLGKLIFDITTSRKIKWFLVAVCPFLKKYLTFFNRDVVEIMVSLLLKIREQRGGKCSSRHDFVDLLLELEQKGEMSGVSMEQPPKEVELEMDIMCQVAQMFIFFAAGFETSSLGTSFLLHQLAYNPEEQRKVQENIDTVMACYDNKLCYEAVSKMTVLDNALKEAMRIFNPTGCIGRVCTRNYLIPGCGVEITPGVRILIPVQALQNDPAYWDQPEQFRPERFAADASPRHNYVYLPFGEGPRACIGARLGQMQSLAGVAAVLHRFTLEPGPSSTPQLQVNTFMNVVQGVKNGIPLLIKERKKKIS